MLGSELVGVASRQAEVKRRTCRSAARPSAAKKKRLKQQYLRKDSSGSCKIYFDEFSADARSRKT